MRKFVVALFVALLVCCSDTHSPPVYHSDQPPTNLSDWNLFNTKSGRLILSEGVVPYDLNSPLFSDYALKLRTIWVPEDSRGQFNQQNGLIFPTGTVISKTFYYRKGKLDGMVLKKEESSGRLNPILQQLNEVLLIETRLLVLRIDGWEAISYVWDEDQSDAKLTRIGDIKSLTLVDEFSKEQSFAYLVPDINQCAGCHAMNNTTKVIEPIGVRPRHFDKIFAHEEQIYNQVDHLEVLGYLKNTELKESVIPAVDWTDTDYSIDKRARAYLDINCSHCHNPVGPADTSGLDLTLSAVKPIETGICKLPIAAGSGTGGRLFSIVPGQPEASILVHRLETMDPGAMMPELGRSVVHQEGVALIRDWIKEMDGEC